MSTHPPTSNTPLVFLNEFARNKPNDMRHTNASCPFCDREHLTHILRTDGDCIWLENKYRTLKDTHQTVLIESRDHSADTAVYTSQEHRHIMATACSCWSEMLRSHTYRSVLMYKNSGPLSGGTLQHPHIQIVGLNTLDGYAHIDQNAFQGLGIVNSIHRHITVSTSPIMGFVELNCAVPESETIGIPHADDAFWFADTVQCLVRYILTNYHGGGCTSYNLFFYRSEGPFDTNMSMNDTDAQTFIVCKVVPRWIASPYYVGYRLAQVDSETMLTTIVNDLRPLIQVIA